MSECNSIECNWLTADLTDSKKNRYDTTQSKILLRKYYYKERLRGQARDKYRNLSEAEKNKKREYAKNRYHNMSEEKKAKTKRI